MLLIENNSKSIGRGIPNSELQNAVFVFLGKFKSNNTRRWYKNDLSEFFSIVAKYFDVKAIEDIQDQHTVFYHQRLSEKKTAIKVKIDFIEFP